MIFHQTPVPDVRLVEPDKHGDARGFFARLFCTQEFTDAGLEGRFVQVNNSLSGRKGTLRGLHYQVPPAAEVKIVRCVRGALWDVVVDLRPDSAGFGKWFGAELSAENRLMMYVPRGFAHGLVTLTADVEAIYLVSDFYSPDHERGLRWNDPRFGIDWPLAPAEISDKDARWPDFDPGFHAVEALRGLR